MSMERAYFERMAQAYSAPDQDQYLRHVAKADALFDANEYAKLDTLLKSALASTPGDAELNWRAARVNKKLADGKSKKEQEP